MLTFIRLLTFPIPFKPEGSIAVRVQLRVLMTQKMALWPLVVVPDGAKEDFGIIVKP